LANSDLQPYVKDIRWLFVRCKNGGLPAPQSQQCEAFAERVAIMIVENQWDGGRAREEAFRLIHS
jgi:hypothetical protein